MEVFLWQTDIKKISRLICIIEGYLSVFIYLLTFLVSKNEIKPSLFFLKLKEILRYPLVNCIISKQEKYLLS